METRVDVIVRSAQLAEELGYEFFGLAEGWGFDSTVVLAAVAAQTRQITLVSTILSIWGRTPATLAMNTATMDLITGGRYVLGLGASTPTLAEGFHDVGFDRPAARLREVTTHVRALLAGDRAQLQRDTTYRPLKLALPPRPHVPIWHGTVGPLSTSVTAEIADAWHPAWLARDGVAQLRDRLVAIRREAAQRTEPLLVVAGPTVVVNADVEAARATAAAQIAWYFCSMGELHPQFVARQGFGHEVEAVRAANRRITPTSGVVPPEAEVLFDQFTAVGSTEDVRNQLRAWDEVVDVVAVGLPPAGSPWEDIERTLRAGAA